MYVCICRGVTDSDIREAIEAGAQSVADVAISLGAGTGCGSCVEYTQSMLEAAQNGTDTGAAELAYAAQ